MRSARAVVDTEKRGSRHRPWFALPGWMVGIVHWKRRTPLERLMPSLDRQLVELANGRRST